MPSLIPGFEYDIFISYRQKDNKHDGWVTDFVDNLKGELESTFKEEISVYFDINPHDGLLETHDVDASLKEKLRCAVFIPIISRTYCDLKSFAWEHELKAFVELASHDQFGLKIKLPNGNVASRVLPVRIHDLDNNDIKLCESVLGGILRGIEFIYKSAGVNRPLRLKEENPHDNLNRTIYPDQINKVANAVREIISGLQKIEIPLPEGGKDKTGRVRQVIAEQPDISPSGEKASEKPHKMKTIHTKKKIWIYSLSSVVVISLAVLSFLFFSTGSALPFSERDWIIITDFENSTGNPIFDKSLYTAFSLSTSQSRYINIFPRSRMLETLKRMEIMEQAFIDEKTGREIAIRERITIYIVPSISKVGNRYAIAAKIMETQSGNPMKSEILYTETQDDIMPGLDQLCKKIRRDLGESRYNIALQDKSLAKVTTSSLEALKLYTLGIEKHTKSDFHGARNYYEYALRIDSGFTAAKASLGTINIELGRRRFEGFDTVKGRELLSQALKTIDNLTEREKLGILGFHAVNVEKNYPKGLEYERMRTELYPDDPAARNNMGWYYQNSDQFENAVKEYKEAIRIDPNMVLPFGGLLQTYLQFIGNKDSALVWAEKMMSHHPRNIWSHIHMGSALVCSDSISKAISYFRNAIEINPGVLAGHRRLAHAYHRQKLYDESIQALKQLLEIFKYERGVYYLIGVNYLSMGNLEEALKYFTDFKKIITE